MKKTLKIILWMLLGAALLVLIAFGGFAFFIYKNVKSHVLEYSCNTYVTDMDAIWQQPEEDGMKQRMRPVGIITTLMGYASVRENGAMRDDLFTDKETLYKYNNEIMSICKANPDLVMFNLLKDVKKDSVPPEVTQQINNLLAGVTVTDHPQGRAFIDIVSKGIADRIALEKEAASHMRAVSATDVTPSTQPAAH